MDLADYLDWTRTLQQRLEPRPEVLGLVALGSMAGTERQPDALSDHDFFVVARADAAEGLRNGTDWLPRAEDIRLRYRETAHGVKVVYASGHLLEFAVFTPDELALARVNAYRVLMDRADISARMTAVAAATARRVDEEKPGDDWLTGQLLTEVLVSALRHARGEHLSAAQRRLAATTHFFRLAARHLPAPGLDSLDPVRRVEQAYPAFTRALEGTHRDALLALLQLAEEHLAARMPGFPLEGLKAVRDRVRSLDG